MEVSRFRSLCQSPTMQHRDGLVVASGPRKQIVPLLLCILVSLSCLFLFSFPVSNHNSQIQIQFRSPNPGPNFTFIIKLLTYDRLASLSRCLKSLSKAHYDAGDRVHLHVFIDHFPLDSRDSSAELDQKLNLSRTVLDFVDAFDWKFGEKILHYRTSNAGLQAQWLEAWWPTSDHEFAFVVEDDLELSPLYYRFVKAVIMNFYYNASNFSPSIYGASLQRPRFVPVGTWGQLLFPRQWKEFRLWYDTHKAKGMKPFLGGMVTNGWYKRLGEKIWTPWFIKFNQSCAYFNIYTNFPHERALSISHRDAGVNYGKTAGPDSYLLDENSVDSRLLELYPLNDLQWYDFCFKQVHPNKIVRSSKDLESVVQYVQKNNCVVIVSLYRVPEPVVRNMLCQFARLNIQNYILLGPVSEFLLVLARRGHPVIDASQFSNVAQLSKSVNFHETSLELIKEILVVVYATEKSLELGYNTWLLDGSTLPIRSDLFFDSFGSTNDVYIGKNSKLLFVRSSSHSLKILADDFAQSAVSLADALRKESVSDNRITFFVVSKLLEKQNAQFGNIDDMELGLDVVSVHANQMTFHKKNKYIFWSSGMELDIIQRQLQHRELWAVDGDSSCTSVICHQS